MLQMRVIWGAFGVLPYLLTLDVSVGYENSSTPFGMNLVGIGLVNCRCGWNI